MSLIIRSDRGGAHFSDDKVYRFRLWRDWDANICKRGRCAFIGLNPSTATEGVNDPTIERCERRARAWGFGGLVMVNLFALRATDPRELKRHAEPIGGRENDHAIAEACGAARIVIAAWGEHGKLKNRAAKVKTLLRLGFINLHALKINSSGEPAHPLYLPYSLNPKEWINAKGVNVWKTSKEWVPRGEMAELSQELDSGSPAMVG